MTDASASLIALRTELEASDETLGLAVPELRIQWFRIGLEC